MTIEKCCRACDGRGARRTVDKENVFKERVVSCSPCGGTGKISPPTGKRGFRRAPKSEDDENDLNSAADAFLRRHGFNKHGR